MSSGTSTPAAAALLAASGPATPSMAPCPNRSGSSTQPLLDHVGKERRDHRAAARQHAQREADRRSAQPRLPRSLPVVAAHAREVVQRHDLHLIAAVTPGLIQGLPHGEESDDEDDDIDAVEQLRDAERQPRLAGQLVDADQSQRQAQEEAEQPSGDDEPSSTDTVVNATTVSAKYSAGPKRSANDASGGAKNVSAERGERARHERSDGRRRQRRRPAALARHHVAVDGRDDRRRLAGGVQQDAGRGPAVHRPVVDAGEHDERARGLEVNVTGSSSATVSAGPMPGRTPTAVPSVTPASAHARCGSVRALANPWPSACRMSMVMLRVGSAASRASARGSPRATSRSARERTEDTRRSRRRARTAHRVRVPLVECPGRQPEERRGREHESGRSISARSRAIAGRHQRGGPPSWASCSPASMAATTLCGLERPSTAAPPKNRRPASTSSGYTPAVHAAPFAPVPTRAWSGSRAPALSSACTNRVELVARQVAIDPAIALERLAPFRRPHHGLDRLLETCAGRRG